MKDKKPNLLLVIPNLGSGGAQRVFHQHRHFLSDNYNVLSCVFNFDGAFPDEIKDTIVSLDVPAGRNLMSKTLNFFKRVARLKKLKRDRKIDLTISHLEGADYVNILSRRNDKIILWIHGSKVHDQQISGFTGWLRRKILLPFLYRRADKIACVSVGIADELKSLTSSPSGKIVTVRNGIDLAWIQKKSTEPLPPEWKELMSEHFVVVTHCRLAPQKNLRALIHVISGLTDIHDLHFVIIGDGEQREELRQLAIKLNIETRVSFPGQQANPFPWLRNSKLYVLTSLWEGFPLSMCEAIACGLPVVAADCYTGPKEILALSNAGILAPLVQEGSRFSIDAWTNILRRLIADKQALETYRANTIKNAGRFSSDNSKLETLLVINDVLK